LEKILVIQTAFIGDAILTLPMVQKLKELFPLSEIDVVAIPSTSLIFSSSPEVNNVLILDKRGKHKTLPGFLKFCFMVKKCKYTRIYSPHRSLRSSLLVLLSGVKETYGFSKNSLRQVYKHIVEYNPAHHEVQRNLDLIGGAEENWRILPKITISNEVEDKVSKYLVKAGISGKIIALAPGSVWATKKYPSEYFIQVAEQLNKRDFFVILTGGIEDKNICDSIRDSVNSNKVISAAGDLSLIESIELFKRCSLVICNDSAPTHMAMCAGTKALTIYCSTVASFGFYPYSEGSQWLSYDNLSCKPCGIHGYRKCPVKTFDCGLNLKPLQVIKKVEEMLDDD
jgi:heptosyltransferase-2